MYVRQANQWGAVAALVMLLALGWQVAIDAVRGVYAPVTARRAEIDRIWTK